MKLCLLLFCAAALAGMHASPVHKRKLYKLAKTEQHLIGGDKLVQSPHAELLKTKMAAKAEEHFKLHKQSKQEQASCPGREPVSDDGILASPGLLDGGYVDNMHCTWTVTVTEGMFARVDFLSMDLEASCGCWYDWVKVMDGGRELGSFCGSDTPGPITGSSNTLEIIFHTDFSVTALGFEILISETDEQVFAVGTDHPACPGPSNMSAADGTITSLNFGDGGYHNNQACTWRLTAPDGQYVVLSFLAMDIEKNSGCTYDRLTIYDGATDLAASMTYCGGPRVGDDLPAAFHSTGQEVFVTFTTDGSVTGDGFHITSSLSDAPGAVIADNPFLSSPGPQHMYVNTTTTIYSPFFLSSGYRNYEFSSWLVEAPQDMFLNVHFVALDLENHRHCAYDYVTIEDGPSTVDSFIRPRMCGNVLPDDFVTTTTSALIEFVSDYSVTRQGFHIELTPVTEAGNIIEDSEDSGEDYESEWWYLGEYSYSYWSPSSSSSWSYNYVDSTGYAPTASTRDAAAKTEVHVTEAEKREHSRRLLAKLNQLLASRDQEGLIG